MLVDVFGYVRRNSKNWKYDQLKKSIIEFKQILSYLERKLKDMEGAA